MLGNFKVITLAFSASGRSLCIEVDKGFEQALTKTRRTDRQSRGL